jgi:hypothetical protein
MYLDKAYIQVHREISQPEIFEFIKWLERIIKQWFSHNFKKIKWF